MRCLKCRAENATTRRFCAKCGSPLPSLCPGCGFENEPTAMFCGGCGKPIGDAPALTPPAALSPPRTEAAERRQLTVMFCDLVGSTPLSSRLDPEDLREVIAAYHRAVAGVVTAFDGFVGRYMGDGVLVYFGYPRAHEDDAERAVRAGLGAIDAVTRLDVGSAKACNRAARFGVSPTTDCSCAGPAPIKSPTTTSPVAIPTRACSLALRTELGQRMALRGWQ